MPTKPEATQTILDPMGSLVLGENKASAAILSQDALGLRFFPEHSFPLQNAAPGIAIGVNSEIGPRWGPPYLAFGGVVRAR